MDMVGHYAIRPEDDTISQDEREQWDKFWALDAAGTQEFSGTEKAARAEQDKKVWQQLNDAIDGTIRWVLQQVDEAITYQGHQVHYIPHQPVITPHKTITKLRVAFDASAHYKGCPSLNDVLHWGPVILLLIYGILLRFRIGTIAIISDVEKAFLQIRLQGKDRDATRCFWLRDHKSPPSLNKTVTFRFTRVTLGLKSSRFLLAGATHYHLDRYENESNMVQDIKRNLYVDNLLLTTGTTEEAVGIYRQTKQIFQDLNTNLREFWSNDNHLMETINETDKTSGTSPKVLGILWDVKKDTILVSVSLPDTPLVTKRTVINAIASIDDPLGWTIPLLHRAKIFLQGLWEEQYECYTILPKEKADE
ncbi:hypothetical protein ANCCAN_26576 [Ancylostoma caninum]|uniref:Pao retrotransposon peptidase n=1 Tax=Ancylostoma caninum TaxID=29170 RepID=A0A368F7Y4_ANCCA|nr:hypothetical protein ANCCAN_26576 [Ancylostoma caninum]